ncbi:MAG TPA: hypothetical protein VFM09_14565 [Marmoricola sp.]|nr:hypothetical protein [Marmoricola sp.]
MSLPSAIVGRRSPRVNVPVRTRTSALVALACAASAGVHAALVPAHLREGGPVLGGAFVLAALLLAAAGLLASGGRTAPAATVLAGTALAWLLSRTTGIPGLLDREPPDPLGVAITVVEVVATLAAVTLPHHREDT